MWIPGVSEKACNKMTHLTQSEPGSVSDFYKAPSPRMFGERLRTSAAEKPSGKNNRAMKRAVVFASDQKEPLRISRNSRGLNVPAISIV